MLSLIENMLKIQKFEHTDVKLNLDTYRLDVLVKDARDEVAFLSEEKRIQIVSPIFQSEKVKIDREVILRVFTNLLSNAIKFSPPGGTIEIVAQKAPDHSGTLLMGIKDQGPGIPPEKRQMIFDKFSQVEARDSGNIRSTGIGLTFCKLAVEAHGGKIWVEAEMGKGSTFWFHLPLSVNESLSSDRIEEIPNKDHYRAKNFKLDKIDLQLLVPYFSKINTLSIYETGEWLAIFDQLKEVETENIKSWKEMMLESITAFDEGAFLTLLALVFDNSILNEASSIQ
jgi:sensor histidine kinase YesM